MLLFEEASLCLVRAPETTEMEYRKKTVQCASFKRRESTGKKKDLRVSLLGPKLGADPLSS